MESIIKDQLVSYLLRKNYISKKQHAFLRRHSTATNLLECTHDWVISLSKNMCVDVVYIDFSRAFDSIVFSKLLSKLSSYGIDGKLLSWLDAFLHNRLQYVVIENCFSNVSDVVSGVPQGSVLGPIMFLIFINDIETVCCGDTDLQLFADDLKLYSSVKVSCNSLTLQQSIDNLALWADKWQLNINISKCAVLTIGAKGGYCGSVYFINNTQLVSTNSFIDLGIDTDSSLSYHNHISSIVSKAAQRVGILFRGFMTRDLQFMRKAFITYIRPLLEYNSCVWNPHQKEYINLIEKVQRRFTKRIPSLRDLSYTERLAIINLEPLELRRLKTDLTEYYKIFNNLDAIEYSDHFNFYEPLASTRSSSPKLIKPAKGNNTVMFSFFNRAIDCWNSLPHNLRFCNSLSTFKRQLCTIDLSSFLIFN